MEKAYCLYRVSTKKQVDPKDDIPMQKIACREFAQNNNWIIAKEFLEKGISGFKVSATKRDAIQDLKEAALNKEFDILLVYMFDRLGRRDDETPFIVEWFVKQGIRVWSTQEGEQRFENQTDKLLNYIRFWQANGESVKTSARIKTRLEQLTNEGIYTGGVTPYGYKLVPSGVTNKKGRELKKLVIDEREADIVRMVFDKTVNNGYGSYRMARYLNELGIRTHNGSEFQCNNINRMLKNRIYCGYYVAKENVSPKQEHLVIIDEWQYNEAQNILKQRSVKNTDKKHIARTTKGRTLLSGNIVCAHCGSRMTATTHYDKYVLADNTVVKNEVLKYICYHRTRRLNDCDGQGSYVAKRVDDEVNQILIDYLSKIKDTPKDKALEIRYKKQIEQCRNKVKELQQEKDKLDNRLKELAAEVGRALVGESKFSVDILSMSLDKTKEDIRIIEVELNECNKTLYEKNTLFNQLDNSYAQFQGWANEYMHATLEQKKMIACQLIDEVRVGRGYSMEIVFNMTYKQFVMEE